MNSNIDSLRTCLQVYLTHKFNKDTQACNQTLLEGGSKPGMVTQMNSRLGPILVRNTFSMCVAF